MVQKVGICNSVWPKISISTLVCNERLLSSLHTTRVCRLVTWHGMILCRIISISAIGVSNVVRGEITLNTTILQLLYLRLFKISIINPDPPWVPSPLFEMTLTSGRKLLSQKKKTRSACSVARSSYTHS